jgi:hypothetical protein
VGTTYLEKLWNCVFFAAEPFEDVFLNGVRVFLASGGRVFKLLRRGEILFPGNRIKKLASPTTHGLVDGFPIASDPCLPLFFFDGIEAV